MQTSPAVWPGLRVVLGCQLATLVVSLTVAGNMNEHRPNLAVCLEPCYSLGSLALWMARTALGGRFHDSRTTAHTRRARLRSTVYGSVLMVSANEAFSKVAAQACTILDGMNESEARAAWLEIVRLQEAIDRVALLHAPNSEGWRP